MSQISVNIKYIVTKNDHETVENVKAKIDTSAEVGDFLQALQDSIKELGRKSQLFLAVEPSESLERFKLQEGDTLVVIAKNTPIVVLENAPKK